MRPSGPFDRYDVNQGLAPPLAQRPNWLFDSASLAARMILAIFAMTLITGCTGGGVSVSPGNTPQQQRAYAMWKERCGKSEEFVHKVVDGVEGLFLLNIRTRSNHGETLEDQFALDDPYGNDSTGKEYILNFLHGFYNRTPEATPKIAGGPPRAGFGYVEALDPKDGKLYRYTGRVEQPWQYDKSYVKDYTRFVLDRTPIDRRTARYGLKFDDISTREEREHWIAGSSLKVVDLDTQEVIAERVGYMVDWAQGSRGGGRRPWLFAAEYACPDFFDRFPRRAGHAFTAQLGQTLDFAEKALKSTYRKP